MYMFGCCFTGDGKKKTIGEDRIDIMSLLKFSIDCSLPALEIPGPLFMVWENIDIGKNVVGKTELRVIF